MLKGLFRNKKTNIFIPPILSIIINNDLPRCGYFAVKLFGIVFHLDVELLFAAIDFKVVWHSPRVPAGSVSAEGHGALSYLFAVGTCDEDSWYNLIITHFGNQSG